MTQGVVDQQLAGKASSTSTPTQYVYFFGGGAADGNGRMKDTLGGKGAGLAEMTNAGLPVTSRLHNPDRVLPRMHARSTHPDMDAEIRAALGSWNGSSGDISARVLGGESQ